VIETVKEFLKKHNQTQKWLATNIDVSDAQISSFLGGNYRGNVQNLELKIKNFIENFIPNEDKSQEVEFFIENQNTAYINHIMQSAIKQIRLSAITGKPGYGKTTAVKKFIENRPNCIYIKANNLFTTKDFLAILCKELNIKIENRGREMFESIVMSLSRVNKFIVIDEAEWLKDKTLDMVRNIWEESKTPVILVGTLILKQNLKGVRGELDYVNSRIRGRYTLESLSNEDIVKVCSYYQIDKKGIERIKTLADGSFRLTTFLLDEAKDLANGCGQNMITDEVVNEASKMIID
jgi:DNA transposition AAA+ family ATPase